MSIDFINELNPAEAIRFYYRLGLNVIPVDKEKRAVIKNWNKYTEEPVTENLISKWEKEIVNNGWNIAIVTKWNNLVVYDCDSENIYSLFKNAFKNILGKDPEEITWVCKTGKGYHVYLRIENPLKVKGNKVIFKEEDNGNERELRRQFGGYVVAPPSLHPSGVKYQWIHNKTVEEILEISEENLIRVESLLNQRLWEKEDNTQQITINEERDLTENEIEELIHWLKDYWKEGQRQMILLALSYILRVFGKVKHDSVIKLYEKIKEVLGDDSKDYSQRITGIKLTFEKEIDDVGYRSWLEELGWASEEIEEFKFGILKIINKSVKQLFDKGLSWVYEVITSDLKPLKDENDNLIGYKQEITFKILAVKDGKVIDEIRNVIKVFDVENYKLIEEKPSKKGKRSLLTSKKIEYIKGTLTPHGTYVKLAIIENDKKHVLEGLLDNVLEELHNKFRVLSREGEEKLGQLLSFLAKLEDKTYNYPGIVLDNNKFMATVPNTKEFDYVFPETESQARWLMRIKEAMGITTNDDFIEYLKAWLKYKDFIPENVYYVVLGYSFIAPLLHSLVSITDLKPGLYLIGPLKSGKSTLGKFIAVTGYGSKTLARTALESGFRFDELFSTATIPVLIDDIEKVSPSVVSRLKSMLTGDVEAFRGTGSLKIKEYKLIAVPIITANYDALGLSSDPALIDRLITLKLDWRLTKESVLEFRKTIGKLLIGDKTIAPYLIKTIADVCNELGGLDFFKKKFNEIYEELIANIESEGRSIEKATLVILGLIIANEVFKRVLGLSIDLEKAKKIVIDVFKEPIDVSEFAPEELINLALLLIEPPEDLEIYTKEIDGKNYYAITQELLIKLSQKSKMKLPRKLFDLKNMLLSLFRDLDPHEIYKTERVGSDNKPRKVILIREDLIDKTLGKIDENSKVENKIIENKSIAQGNEICVLCGKAIQKGEEIVIKDNKVFHKSCWNVEKAIEENNSEFKEIIGEPREISSNELNF